MLGFTSSSNFSYGSRLLLHPMCFSPSFCPGLQSSWKEEKQQALATKPKWRDLAAGRNSLQKQLPKRQNNFYPGLGEILRLAEKTSPCSAVSSGPLHGLGGPGQVCLSLIQGQTDLEVAPATHILSLPANPAHFCIITQ